MISSKGQFKEIRVDFNFLFTIANTISHLSSSPILVKVFLLQIR